MAKPDKSINPRILKSAKEEFLKKGFEKASLKTICANADVTTGALYKRYKGKEELFGAVVQPILDDLNVVLESKKIENRGYLTDEQLKQAWDMDEEAMLWWFDFLYQRKDDFVLLLSCSEGTKYSRFDHDWVQVMTTTTYQYYLELVKRDLSHKKISEKELHVLLSAFWATIYEPFIHDFTWDEIVEHSHTVCLLFDWFKVLGI